MDTGVVSAMPISVFHTTRPSDAFTPVNVPVSLATMSQPDRAVGAIDSGPVGRRHASTPVISDNACTCSSAAMNTRPSSITGVTVASRSLIQVDAPSFQACAVIWVGSTTSRRVSPTAIEN